MANSEKNTKPAKAVNNPHYRKARVGKAPKNPSGPTISALVDAYVAREPRALDSFVPPGASKAVRANVARALPFVAASMPSTVPGAHRVRPAPAGVLVVYGQEMYPPRVKGRSKRGWTTPKAAK